MTPRLLLNLQVHSYILGDENGSLVVDLKNVIAIDFNGTTGIATFGTEMEISFALGLDHCPRP